MFARTNHLAVVLGFYPDLAHAFVCVTRILGCHKYHLSKVIHPYLSPSLPPVQIPAVIVPSFHIPYSNTLSCVLQSHIYPLLLQFPCSESVTLFCFSSGVSVSFEFNSHCTLLTLFHTIYIHMQPCMHLETYTHTHTQ